MENKEKILALVKDNMLMVISTIDVGGDKTESAVVGFAETEDLEIVFCTSNTTRKYRNLQKNKNVSLVIGWDGRFGTVQYEGTAEELAGEDVKKYVDILITKNPQVAKFVDRDDQIFFLVKPKWIRMLDMSVKPDETFEI
jgi:uncharacterized pyridoxamine 5'-phosphate oxidase family protein